jgi:NTE family protein
MRVLEREGIPVDLVVGCSGGSIYAATIALGWSAEAASQATTRLWTRSVTSKRNTRGILQLLMPRLFGFDESFGLVDDSLIRSRLDAAFGSTRIEDSAIPMILTATDLFSGALVELTEGSLVEAIRGSISIPYIFAPHRMGDRYLVDGYLSDPLPVGAAIKAGADLILAMGFESPNQREISSLMRYNFQLSSITSNNLLRTNFAFHNLAHHSEIIPIIPEFAERIRLFDTDKIPQIIAAGEKAAEAEMGYIKKFLARPHDSQ